MGNDRACRIGRRAFLGACGAAVAGQWTATAWAAEQRAGRPNIVVFLVDDMGWQDTSVAFWRKPTPFNRHYRTPNMERLAQQGVRFTNAHAHPVCSPTRVSIMTGQNPARHHVTNWIFAPDKDTSGNWGPVASPPWRMEGLQPGDVTLAKLLRDAGYHTIHCGKAHWGAHGTPGSDPLNLGFDVNIAGHAAGAPATYQGLDDYGNKDEKRNAWAVPGLAKYHGTDTHLTDALTNGSSPGARRCGQARQAVLPVHGPLRRPHAHPAPRPVPRSLRKHGLRRHRV